jgi:DHA1 family tetracycline resistance protein-like MFS transporter
VIFSFLSSADTTSIEERAKAFGLIGVVTGLSFMGTPTLSGLLADKYGMTLPFLLATGIFVVGFIVVAVFLEESLVFTQLDSNGKLIENPTFMQRVRSLDWQAANPLHSFAMLFRKPVLVCLALMYFINYIAEEGIMDTFVLFVVARFHWDAFQIGVCFSVLGLCFVLGKCMR